MEPVQFRNLIPKLQKPRNYSVYKNSLSLQQGDGVPPLTAGTADGAYNNLFFNL